MRTRWPQPLDLLPPAGRRVGGEPAPDAADRRAISQDPVLRQPEDGGVPGTLRRGGESQADPAAHGVDGAGGIAPEAADDGTGIRRAGVSLPASRPGAEPYQRGLEFGYHVHSHETWFHVPDGGDRLVQPLRPVVAAVEHAGGSIL